MLQLGDCLHVERTQMEKRGGPTVAEKLIHLYVEIEILLKIKESKARRGLKNMKLWFFVSTYRKVEMYMKREEVLLIDGNEKY